MTLFDKIILLETLFENYKSSSYDDLLVALKVADANIIDRLARTKGEWTRTRLLEIKKLINDEITKSYGGLFEHLQDENAKIGDLVYSYIAGTSIPKSTVQAIVNSNRNIQGYTFKELFKITEDNHARQLRVLVASGVAQGRSIDGIISDYQIKSDKLSRANIRTNINTLVAETKTIAKNKAFEDEFGDVIEGWVYNATLDNSTSIWCRERDNRRYKTLEDINKDLHSHFNCRSVVIPLTDDEDENKRASQFGEVGGLSYEDWFLSLPKAIQRSTLTSRQYEALLKDRYNVKSLNDITKGLKLETISNIINN
jgi:hypothetical protein